MCNNITAIRVLLTTDSNNTLVTEYFINTLLKYVTEFLCRVGLWRFILYNTVTTGLLYGCWGVQHSRVHCSLLVLDVKLKRGLVFGRCSRPDYSVLAEVNIVECFRQRAGCFGTLCSNIHYLNVVYFIRHSVPGTKY